MDARIKTIVAIGTLLHFADSLTTYYILAMGIGEEANPILAPLYHQNPLYTFLVFAVTSAALVAAVYAYTAAIGKLPARRRELLYRMLAIGLAVVAAVKAAPVVNNLCVILMGRAPVVELLEKIF